MSQLAPPALELDEEEKEKLLKLLGRHSTPQEIALRAKIVILASSGKNHRQIARELNIGRLKARRWRERWIEKKKKGIEVIERLQDEERSGAPATFSMEQVLKLFKLACDDPKEYQRPISHWTERELADEMSRQNIVETISPRHVGRLLAEAEIKPHQSGYWLNPPPTQNSMRRSKTSVKSI